MYSPYPFGHILRDQSGTVIGKVEGITELPHPTLLYHEPGNDKGR